MRTRTLSVTVVLLALVSVGLLRAAGTAPQAPPTSASRVQEAAPGPGVATIWYLGHCGYAVKTARHLLMFDYIELEEQVRERGLSKGFVDPAEIAAANLSVFASHSHLDHYDPVILTWEKTIPSIRYFFGWKAGLGARHQDLPAPRASATVDGLEIHTVNSHHSGVPEVAWLVKVDGLVFFHAGDYQGKMARGATSNAADDMRYLMTKTDHVDVAFLGAVVEDWNLNVVNGLAPRALFPMHYRKQEERYRAFAADLAAAGVKRPVICPTRRGDRFEYRDGRVRAQAPETPRDSSTGS